VRRATSSLAANSGALRPNCGDRRRFAGFWRFGAVEKSSRAKGLSATAIERRSVRDGFNPRIRQLSEVRQRAWPMRRSRSAAKLECSEALVPELCFAHGANINSRGESCGKLKANGFCAKCLAAKSGQGEPAKFCDESADSTSASMGRIRGFVVCGRRHSYPRLIVRIFAVRFRKRGFSDGPEP
jgi:hypothetical protein